MLTVDKLKILFDVTEDKELAEKIGITKQAVGSWRKEGVPKTLTSVIKYLSEKNGTTPKVAESEQTHYGPKHPDPEIQNVIEMMEAMDRDTKKDIRLSVQKEKLLRDLLRQKEDREVV